ncbi:MAG: hypothetical protein HZB84_09770, partial [Deltaproteobacteria bacterium]|nr:hypothetical protein [Deltaproteobacteria bacterium]
MRHLTEYSMGKDTVYLEGIKIRFGEDWVVAYPSQDQPYFYLVAEASTEDRAKELLSEYSERIKNWLK